MIKLWAGLICASVFGLTGCSHDDTPTFASGGSGTLVMRMTDSPALFDGVFISVDSVRVHLSASDSTSGWYTLNRMPAMYNLLSLANGIDTVIGSASLPVGSYSQIRLYIGTGSYVVVNGLNFPLSIPSGSQSGLKLNVHADIQANVIYTLLLDFDAARSIILTGSGQYILKPVIRVVTMAQTGNIRGTVVPGQALPQVWAYTATDTVTTMADTTGAFKLTYLSAASYTVRILPTNTVFRDTTITGVVVTAGNTTVLGTIVLRTQ